MNVAASDTAVPGVIRVGDRDTISLGRTMRTVAVLERRTLHVPDIEQLDDSAYGSLKHRLEPTGLRSFLATPLWHGAEVVGVISLSREGLHPFAPVEIALVETFAAQAVIAMENVRLFTHLQEALDQQTATAAVLAVIASSPTELQPVLDAIAAKATTVCGAADGTIWLAQDGVLRRVAHFGPIPYTAVERAIDSGSQTGRAVAEGRTIHVADVLALEDEFPDSAAGVQSLGIRTSLTVPLKREGEIHRGYSHPADRGEAVQG